MLTSVPLSSIEICWSRIITWTPSSPNSLSTSERFFLAAGGDMMVVGFAGDFLTGSGGSSTLDSVLITLLVAGSQTIFFLMTRFAGNGGGGGGSETSGAVSVSTGTIFEEQLGVISPSMSSSHSMVYDLMSNGSSFWGTVIDGDEGASVGSADSSIFVEGRPRREIYVD